MALKPGEELIASVLTAAAVYEIFQLNAPNLADVQASPVGGAASVNTHKSVKMAVYTAAALVVGLGILFKDPAVYVTGAVVTSLEGWKFYKANSTSNGSSAVVAPGAAMNGQPAPTLNSGS